jgi:hypothetical protein
MLYVNTKLVKRCFENTTERIVVVKKDTNYYKKIFLSATL